MSSLICHQQGGRGPAEPGQQGLPRPGRFPFQQGHKGWLLGRGLAQYAEGSGGRGTTSFARRGRAAGASFRHRLCRSAQPSGRLSAGREEGPYAGSTFLMRTAGHRLRDSQASSSAPTGLQPAPGAFSLASLVEDRKGELAMPTSQGASSGGRLYGVRGLSASTATMAEAPLALAWA